MKIIKALKVLPLALIFTASLIFIGCNSESGDGSSALLFTIAATNNWGGAEKTPENSEPGDNPEEKDPEVKDPEEKDPEENAPEEKDPEEKDPEEKDPDEKEPEQKGVQKETVTDKNSVITVKNDTKLLKLSGVKGKSIYMTRSNPSEETLNAAQARYAVILDDSENDARSLKKSEFPVLQGTEKKDPHQIMYEKFLEDLRNYTPTESRALYASSVNDYSVGDIEKFYASKFNDDGTSEIESNVEFKLIVSEDEYNVWVKSDDKYYNQYDTSSESDGNRAKFVEDAEKLGKKFIEGYGIVSHIYGKVSEYLYNNNLSKDSLMTESSRTGDKINILLYDMLDKGGLYGFVTPRDFIKGFNGSNEGRFIYMDSQTIVKNPMEAYTTALHEFSHNISFTQKTLNGGRFWTYWYGELLAMICEDMMQTYLGISDSDVDSYLENTPKVRIAPANYTALWGQGLSGENAMTYSASYMVGAWLTRKFGGIKFVRELARNYYVDMDSILRAVKTVTGKTYTAETLIQEMAGDLLVESEGTGLNQDTRTFTNDTDYIDYYFDENGILQAYNYKFTAINLWEPFYGWCDIYGFGDLIGNSSIEYSALPAGNIYAQIMWAAGQEPETAYLGPLLIKDGTVGGSIGPYGSMLYTLGEAETDDIDIEISSDSSTVKDVLTIWVK